MLGFVKWVLLSAAVTLLALQSSGQDEPRFQAQQDQRQGEEECIDFNVLVYFWAQKASQLNSIRIM